MPTTTPHPQNTDELYQALQENDRRPYGRTRTVTAEELAEVAEQFAEPGPLIDALMELQEAYTYGSEPRKSPVVFARLLSLFDEQPEAFDERTRHQLFWRFKWVAGALRALPEVPLATLRQWQQEMRGRYEKAELGLQPYYNQAYQLALHVGEDTALAYELWAGRIRTPLSDCEACEICLRARHHLAAGDDERALTTWETVLSGKESCQEEPARSVSYALLPLLRTGRTDRARELHLAGYRGCRRNPSMAGEVGRHLEFCALTGNEARGLELLAENRGLFEEVDSPLEQLDFLTGVEVLLRRVELLGHGGVPAAGFTGRVWTAAGLYAEVRTRADDLAARFDARNGTTAHADHRRARLGRAPLLDTLELTLRARTLEDVASAAPLAPLSAPLAPVAAAAAVRAPSEDPSSDLAPSESLPALITRARALHELGHPDADACWARLRTLVAADDYVHPDDPEVGPLVRLRADLLADEASRADERDDHAVAVPLYEQAADLYDDAGAPGDAAVARAFALLALAEMGAGAEGVGDAGDVKGAGDGAGAEVGPGAGSEVAASGAEGGAGTGVGGGAEAGAGAGAATEAGAGVGAGAATEVEARAGVGSGAETKNADRPARNTDRPAEYTDLPTKDADHTAKDTDHPAREADRAARDADRAAETADRTTELRVRAFTTAHTALVRLHEETPETPGLTPHQEGRLLRLRATALVLQLQASRSEKHVAPAFAEVELLRAFATRHDLAGHLSAALLMRVSTHALAGNLPAALTEADTLLQQLTAHGPAWHMPRALALRGRLRLTLQGPEAAHADLAEGLRLAANWPADPRNTTRLHDDLAEVCVRLGRPDEALHHLTRSAELDLRRGSRFDAFCTYSNAARLSLDLGRVEDCIALLDSVLAEPDVASGELDDRLVAQLRLTRARALHAGEDLRAATAEFVALAGESAGWDDDPGSHAMIAAETAALLAESGEFGRAREAADRALAAHARAPRPEPLSSSLRELARLQVKAQGEEGLDQALAYLAAAARVAEEARAAAFEPQGRSLETALAYEYGRVYTYAERYEDALASLAEAAALLGEPGADGNNDENRAGEWTECVRLSAVVEGFYLERHSAALARLDKAISLLTLQGHTDLQEQLSSLAAQLREEE